MASALTSLFMAFWLCCWWLVGLIFVFIKMPNMGKDDKCSWLWLKLLLCSFMRRFFMNLLGLNSLLVLYGCVFVSLWVRLAIILFLMSFCSIGLKFFLLENFIFSFLFGFCRSVCLFSLDFIFLSIDVIVLAIYFIFSVYFVMFFYGCLYECKRKLLYAFTLH